MRLLPLAFFVPALAHALALTPSDAIESTSVNSNLGTLSDINAAFNTNFTGLSLAYKGDAGGGESGSLVDSYSYTIEGTDPDDGFDSFTITFDGQPAAVCPTCILIVKDGNHTPSQYLFNLANWNGTETISGSGFWANGGGAISNVALWQGLDGGGSGTGNEVPIPAAAWLFGSALVGLGSIARKRKAVA